MKPKKSAENVCRQGREGVSVNVSVNVTVRACVNVTVRACVHVCCVRVLVKPGSF